MALSVNATAALNGAGAFATSRRGAIGRDEIEHARRALGSRVTAAQVAKMMGRCEADVRLALTYAAPAETPEPSVAPVRRPRAMIQTPKERRVERDALFRALWTQNLDLDAMQKRFGLSRDGIRKLARRLGLPPRIVKINRVRWTPEMAALVLREFVQARLPASVVAENIPGATKASVIARAYRQGWCTPTKRRAAP